MAIVRSSWQTRGGFQFGAFTTQVQSAPLTASDGIVLSVDPAALMEAYNQATATAADLSTIARATEAAPVVARAAQLETLANQHAQNINTLWSNDCATAFWPNPPYPNLIAGGNPVPNCGFVFYPQRSPNRKAALADQAKKLLAVYRTYVLEIGGKIAQIRAQIKAREDAAIAAENARLAAEAKAREDAAARAAQEQAAAQAQLQAEALAQQQQATQAAVLVAKAQKELQQETEPKILGMSPKTALLGAAAIAAKLLIFK